MPSNNGPSAEPLMLEEFRDTDSRQWQQPAEFDSAEILKRLRKHKNRCPRLAVILPWIIVTAMSIWIWVQYNKRGPLNPIFPQLTYSPAQNALEYEVRKFHLGLDGDETEYEGYPSPELDKKWNALYSMGITKIPLNQAKHLVNRTIIFPHDEDREYIIELDVFHQLHCLNMIRKGLSPEYYKGSMPGPDGEDELLGFHHLNHCVDTIRQSLMCTVDISVLTWQWDETRQKNFEKGSVLHTCRNFERVQQWAEEHVAHGEFDSEFRELDDPLDPRTWT